MSDYNDQHHQPLRARRDDDALAADAGRRARPAAAPRRKLFSAGNLLTLLLAVVLLLSLGLIWRQTEQIEELTRRFDELDQQIRSTDESLSESGTALRIKLNEQGETLDTHWSEIKKLWGVSNDRNRKAIEANQKAVEQASATADQAKSAVDKLQGQLSENRESFQQVESELADMAATVKTLSASFLDVSLRLDEIESRLAALTELRERLDSLSGRTANNEAALNALDDYRSQVNQQLHQLRQKVNALP